MTDRTSPAAPAHWPSEAALIADLQATYPGIHARPLSEFGFRPCQHGVWTGGEATLADGDRIFCALACPDPDHYDGHVHHAFIEWLDLRGWFIEEQDAGVFFIRSKAEEADDMLAALEFSDLMDQEREAKIVLHRLQARIADMKAQSFERHGRDADAQAVRDEAGQHRLELATLRSLRTGAKPAQSDAVPF